MNSSTGAIRTITGLDYESQTFFEFNVRVSDMGRPRLSAETTANVKIFIQDENDSPPVFDENEYFELLLLPTFENVSITQVAATDKDKDVPSQKLTYSITDGNDRKLFAIPPSSRGVGGQQAMTKI